MWTHAVPHDNLTKVTTGEKSSLQSRAAARGSMRSSTCTTPFCTQFPFKMAQGFCCNALSSTWLMQEPLEEACPLLLLHSVLQDNCVTKDQALQNRTRMRKANLRWKRREMHKEQTDSCLKRLQQLPKVHVRRDYRSSKGVHLLGALRRSGSWASPQCREDAGQAISSTVLPPSSATFCTESACCASWNPNNDT